MTKQERKAEIYSLLSDKAKDDAIKNLIETIVDLEFKLQEVSQ